MDCFACREHAMIYHSQRKVSISDLIHMPQLPQAQLHHPPRVQVEYFRNRKLSLLLFSF